MNDRCAHRWAFSSWGGALEEQADDLALPVGQEVTVRVTHCEDALHAVLGAHPAAPRSIHPRGLSAHDQPEDTLRRDAHESRAVLRRALHGERRLSSVAPMGLAAAPASACPRG